MSSVWLYSETNHPHNEGRCAHLWYQPVAKVMQRMGHDVRVIQPGVFQRLGQVIRKLHPLSEERPDHLILWSSKQPAQSIAKDAQRFGVPVYFAELGWFPQSDTIHFDPDGTGPLSSLVWWVPEKDDPKEHINQKKVGGGPIGLLLQVEQDFQFQMNGVVGSNGHFCQMMLQAWPNERFIARYHPACIGAPVPHDPRLKVVMPDEPLNDWFLKCHAVVGVNSTALLNAIDFGMQKVVQIGKGIGHSSGAFMPFGPESVRNLKPGKDRAIAAQQLLYELKHHRQISVKSIAESDILSNRVLGPIAKGASSDNVRGTSEPLPSADA